MNRKPWRTVHTTIDGISIDRDTGYPALDLSMEPIGRLLPPERRTRDLRLKINGTETVLDEEGIAALRAFLDEQP